MNLFVKQENQTNKISIKATTHCYFFQTMDDINQQNNKGIRIFEGQICAGYAEGRTDGCQVVKPGGQYYQNDFAP